MLGRVDRVAMKKHELAVVTETETEMTLAEDTRKGTAVCNYESTVLHVRRGQVGMQIGGGEK